MTVKWNKLRKKIKSSKAWKSAKYVQVQYSTNKNFKKNVKSKKIKKSKINKAQAKSTLSKLKKGKTYYVRARLIDKKGVVSNWSKVAKIKVASTSKKVSSQSLDSLSSAALAASKASS